MEPLQGAHLVPAPSSTHHQREANTQPSPSPSVLGSRSEGQARVFPCSELLETQTPWGPTALPQA